ncbi:hypothetical protein P43SY_011574 [Pythium insidiosum]|uniref:PiggyBac transposable element-derived protein domain-containing protein n=1 Tax=Pythium insidiosum TaxID=114742 RepID=A0AAD5L9N3_PYTIN|nr:hypothetical protein P43SY_011574 [Pythium insidiosum]
MQDENYFDTVDDNDINVATEPIEDDEESDVEGESELDMLFDTFEDDEVGEDQKDDEADSCAVDDDRDMLRNMSHDQLRLHRYSIQKSVRMLKYYKSIFLGIVDMAIVNGFVVHRYEMQAQGKPTPTHAEYIMRLHQELLTITKTDMVAYPVAENLVSAPAQVSEHVLIQTKEVYKGKLRQYMCKRMAVQQAELRGRIRFCKRKRVNTSNDEEDDSEE